MGSTWMALKSSPRQASNPKLPPTNLTTSTALLPLGGEGGRRPDEGASAIQRRPAKPFRPRARLCNSCQLCTTAPFFFVGCDKRASANAGTPSAPSFKSQISNPQSSTLPQPSTRNSTKHPQLNQAPAIPPSTKNLRLNQAPVLQPGTRALQPIRRTLHRQPRLVHHVQVNHRRSDVFVPQHLLHGTNVGATLKKSAK